MNAFLGRAALAAAMLAIPLAGSAATLTVTHWGDGMYGAPFAVALDKGYFKEGGLDVTGFITSEGGGTSIRNAMASEIPYGEVALSAAIAAIKQGMPITIVHGGVQSLADQLWVQNPDNTIASMADMKGKTMGYSSPKSVTDLVSTVAIERAGLAGQVNRKPVGSSGSMMIALQQKAVDVAYITEPSYSAHKDVLKIAFRSVDIVPTQTQTVGIVRTDYLKQHPDTVKAIINARRKGVQYLIAHQDEAARILAKAYKMDLAVTRSAIHTCLTGDPHYWSTGGFNRASMDEVAKGLVLIKAADPGPFDWSKVIDDSLLPASERSQ